MSAITVEGLESSLTSDSSTISGIVTDFAEAVDAPESATEPFVELVEGMATQLEETAQEAARARERARTAEERVEELEEELSQHRAERAKEAAEDRQRIHQVEERLDSVEEGGSGDETPTPEVGKTAIQQPQTPLERTVALPEGIADSELTANQKRARFVARDVHEYTRSVPAGRAIKSSEIGTVLRAGTDCKGRSQTVSRVIEFLNDLGGDGVKVVERRGERRVVFDEETAHRLSQVGTSDPNDSGVATVGG